METHPELTEERAAGAEDDRCDVQVQLIDQSGLQGLLRDAGAAADHDIPVAGDLAGSIDCRLDAVDELESRFRVGLLVDAVGDDDARTERRRLSE